MKIRIIVLLSIIFSCGSPDQYRFNGESGLIQATAIEIHLPSTSLVTGDEIQAHLLVLYSDGRKDIYSGDDLQWSSSEPAVSEISGAGMITARGEGESDITAVLNEFTTARRIRVHDAPDFSGLVLGEIFYDPAGPESGREFIELRNTGIHECDISGFRIIDGSDSSTPFIFPQGSVIMQGHCLVLCQSSIEFFNIFGFYPDYSPFSFSLNNAGETVFLLHPDGTVRDAVYIEGGSAEFTAPSGWNSSSLPSAAEGFSIHRKNSPDTNSAQDWESAAPSPGT